MVALRRTEYAAVPCMATHRMWDELEPQARIWAITVMASCLLVLAILVIWVAG